MKTGGLGMGDVQLGGMYYIVDSFGNYYFVNGENQLVTAGGKEKQKRFNETGKDCPVLFMFVIRHGIIR